MDEKDGSQAERQSNHGVLLGILGVLLAVAALAVKVSFPFYLDTWIGFAFLLIFLLSLTRLTVLALATRKGQRRPIALSATVAVTLISGTLVAVVTEPVYKSDEAIDCKFGNVGFGVGEGRVWVKAEVPRDGTYTFHITWGAVEATRKADLHSEVYFTFRKRDFWSIGYATASISPTATLSCGNNTPPSGVKNIEIVDTDWHKRADANAGASSRTPPTGTSPSLQAGLATVHRV
ncbi:MULTISPECIES: hypothetical protein [Amycolatopsis]|uniref:Uncharacterized protein n=1 Tax=Amycolatopsis bullii TaxID=941987 RepID=A0ABQ3KMM0_9PSEU|nr:hypothetical protein [Amycolatopsis bullii]GHG29812.1 hypothetical protein GCM10017567_56930 [Amycolatopsis bullii]